MKQTETGKNKKWIWWLVALALLVAAGVAAALLLQPAPQVEQPPVEQEALSSPLYWNVDQKKMLENSETGLSNREPAEDGNYYIRFVVDGQLVELQVADARLVNYIDSLTVMGLVLDDNGAIVDVIAPKELVKELGRDIYVRKLESNRLVLNSSVSMNGMNFDLIITEKTGIYDVSPDAAQPGCAGTPGQMDTVSAFTDAEGNLTHVFITQKAKASDIYWRVGTYWNDASGTTRQEDENGVYTMCFAHRGQQVELKCKEKAIVEQIDRLGANNAACGLVLDEEGYIVEYMAPILGIRGIELCNNANLTELTENTFAATRFLVGEQQGKSVQGIIPADAEIYLVCDGGTVESYIGEPTTLQPTDRITCYTDLDGQIKLIYVTRRMVDVPMYFNLSRQYISSQQRTERKPDKSGWYTFEMAVNGKVKTVKTKSLDVANQIDSYSTRAMGLELDGSVVKKIYSAESVCGWTTAANGRYVTAFSNGILSAAHPGDFENFANFVLNADCEVYDVSGAYGTTAKKTQVQQGDEIIAFRDPNGNLTHVYVTGRYQSGTKIYYNTARRYNSLTQETTRTPDAEGYYVYAMVCQGKEITVKTKDKALASYIDKQNAPLIAMKVSDGVVKKAYPATAAVRYSNKTANFHYVDSVSGGKLKTYYISDGERKENPTTYTLANDCVIYNVSEGYVNQRGEKSKLRKDDRIQALVTNPKGQITTIFIMERKIESSLYWNKTPMYKNGETTRTPDAEGYYVYELAVKGYVRTLKTKDKALADKLDSYTTAVGLLLDGDIIKQVYPTSTVKGIKTLSIGRYDVMEINGKTVTFQRNRPTSDNFGDVQKVKMASGCKVFDVSSYAETFGAAVELQPGDRVAGYTDEDGKLVYAYIVARNTHKAGHVSFCDHCGQEVFWEPYTTEIVSADVHYYLPCDTTIASRLNIGRADDDNQYDMVFDLNGFILSCRQQAFLVCDKLAILDTAGGGEIRVSTGSGIMVSGGELKLYSGTVTTNPEGCTPTNGNLIYLATNARFTMYGGTLAGGAAPEKGGNVLVTSTATFTMEGGLITGGTAPQGGNVHATGRMCLRGGSINGGEVYVAETQKTVLTGKPMVEKLTVVTGKLLVLDSLKDGTAIGIHANGVFTVANDNAESYVNYFVPLQDEYIITVVEGGLSSGLFLSPDADVGTVANAMVFPEDGSDYVANCPACGAKSVTWKAITGNNRVGYNTAGHFYCMDITQNPHTQFIGIDSKLTVCLHLNGQNLKNVGRIAVSGGDGVINIMGSGSVTGLGTTSGDYKQGTLVVQNKGTINLYGGTYRSELADMPVAYVQHADSVLNLYTGAVLEGGISHTVDVINGKLNICGGDIRGGASSGSGGNIRVRSLYGVVTMYGGTISGGTSSAANAGGNVYLTGNSRFEMYGGKIFGGTATTGVGGNVHIYNGTFVLHDGEITGGTAPQGGNVYATGSLCLCGGNINSGEVYVAETQKTVLTGKPVVEQLTVETGKLLILDALEEGASIGIDANGVFTAVNENAESYVNYFTPLREEHIITAVEGALNSGVPMLPEVEVGVKISAAANAMVFPADGSDYVADCPACGATQVTWKAIKGNARVGYNTGGHFYCLDITQNPHTQFIGIDTQITVCLHLNGQNLRNVGRIAITGGDGTINIMGSGSVTGLGTTTGDYKQGTLVVQNKGTINLYGGTYRSELADMPVAYVQHADSVLNLYTGAVLEGSVGHTVDVINGKLNICGGDIRGGTSSGSGGNIRVRSLYGVVTMYGGTVSGGTSSAANAGGNVYLTGNSRFEMYGGKIFGGTATTGAGGNVNIYKGTFILHDGEITGGTAATDPNISVSSAEGIFTQQGGTIE